MLFFFTVPSPLMEREALEHNAFIQTSEGLELSKPIHVQLSTLIQTEERGRVKIVTFVQLCI